MEKDRKDQPLMLPKYRYDELNQKYKEARQQLETVKAAAELRSREIEKLQEELQRMKIYLDHALIDLQVKETFVEGGITKAQYEAIIPKMTCRDEEKLPLAKAAGLSA